MTGLIALPALSCPFGQMTDSVDVFVELGQRLIELTNPRGCCGFLCCFVLAFVYVLIGTECLRLSLDVLLLVFRAWQRKSKIDSS